MNCFSSMSKIPCKSYSNKYKLLNNKCTMNLCYCLMFCRGNKRHFFFTDRSKTNQFINYQRETPHIDTSTFPKLISLFTLFCLVFFCSSSICIFVDVALMAALFYTDSQLVILISHRERFSSLANPDSQKKMKLKFALEIMSAKCRRFRKRNYTIISLSNYVLCGS